MCHVRCCGSTSVAPVVLECSVEKAWEWGSQLLLSQGLRLTLGKVISILQEQHAQWFMENEICSFHTPMSWIIYIFFRVAWLQFCLFALSWLLFPFLNLSLSIFFISSRATMTPLPWQVFLCMLDLLVQFPKIFPVDGKRALLCFNYRGFCYLFLSPLQVYRSPPPPTVFPGHIPFVYPQGWCPWPQTVNSLFHAHLESITAHCAKSFHLWKGSMCSAGLRRPHVLSLLLIMTGAADFLQSESVS